MKIYYIIFSLLLFGADSRTQEASSSSPPSAVQGQQGTSSSSSPPSAVQGQQGTSSSSSPPSAVQGQQGGQQEAGRHENHGGSAAASSGQGGPQKKSIEKMDNSAVSRTQNADPYGHYSSFFSSQDYPSRPDFIWNLIHNMDSYNLNDNLQNLTNILNSLSNLNQQEKKVFFMKLYLLPEGKFDTPVLKFIQTSLNKDASLDSYTSEALYTVIMVSNNGDTHIKPDDIAEKINSVNPAAKERVIQNIINISDAEKSIHGKYYYDILIKTVDQLEGTSIKQKELKKFINKLKALIAWNLGADVDDIYAKRKMYWEHLKHYSTRQIETKLDFTDEYVRQIKKEDKKIHDHIIKKIQNKFKLPGTIILINEKFDQNHIYPNYSEAEFYVKIIYKMREKHVFGTNDKESMDELYNNLNLMSLEIKRQDTKKKEQSWWSWLMGY